MTTSFGNSLAPAQLAGSYLDRMATALDLIEAGDLDQAEAIVERVIDRLGRLPERKRKRDRDLGKLLISARSILVDIKARQGEWEAVDTLCQRMMQLDEESASAWLYRPWNLRINFGRTAEGLAGMRTLAEQEPENFGVWLRLAGLALEVDDDALAEYALQRSEALAPLHESPEAMGDLHLSRFYLLWRRRQYHAARAAWETALAYDPEIVDIQDAVVRMFIEAGLLDEALQFVDDDVLTEPLADYLRAWIANQRGDYVRARYLWRSIIEIGPEETEFDIAVLQAMAYCWLRQPEAALTLLLQMTERNREVRFLDAMALALAWAMHGDKEAAHANLKLASKRSAPEANPDRLLGYFHWLDFEQLVADDAIKAELRPYFETLGWP
jgi:tetratricopeptide (TPR) repeat protein